MNPMKTEHRFISMICTEEKQTEIIQSFLHPLKNVHEIVVSGMFFYFVNAIKSEFQLKQNNENRQTNTI